MILDQIKLELENISNSYIQPIHSFTINETQEDILKGIENFGVIGFMKPRSIEERDQLSITYYFSENKKLIILKSFENKLGDTQDSKCEGIKIIKENISIHDNKLAQGVGKIKHEYNIETGKPDRKFIYEKFERALPNHFYRYKDCDLKLVSLVKKKKFVAMIINQNEIENRVKVQYYSEKTSNNKLSNNYRTTIGDIERKLIHYVRRIQENTKTENFDSITYIEHEYEII